MTEPNKNDTTDSLGPSLSRAAVKHTHLDVVKRVLPGINFQHPLYTSHVPVQWAGARRNSGSLGRSHGTVLEGSLLKHDVREIGWLDSDTGAAGSDVYRYVPLGRWGVYLPLKTISFFPPLYSPTLFLPMFTGLIISIARPLQ